MLPAEFPYPVVPIPMWTDSGFILSNFEYSTETITIPAAGFVSLVAADPDRWAIGFTGTAAGTSKVSPFNDTSGTGWSLPQQPVADDNWFYLFRHGPMVTYEWFGVGPMGNVIRVHTVRRHG